MQHRSHQPCWDQLAPSPSPCLLHPALSPTPTDPPGAGALWYRAVLFTTELLLAEPGIH